MRVTNLLQGVAERTDGARVSPHARRGARGGCSTECRRNRAECCAHIAACSQLPLAGLGEFYELSDCFTYPGAFSDLQII